MSNVRKTLVGTREWSVQDIEDDKEIAYPSPSICCVRDDKGWRPGRIYKDGIILYGGIEPSSDLSVASKIHDADPERYVTDIRVSSNGHRHFANMIVSCVIMWAMSLVWDIDLWMALLGVLLMHATALIHDMLDEHPLR